MNKMTQAALAALVLGVCSTGVYATEDVASFGGSGGGNHHSGNSGCGTDCKGSIDITLEVPKHCDLDINKKTIVMTKGSGITWSGSSSFDVSANAPYSLTITKPSTLVNGSASIGVSVATLLGSAPYTGGTLSYQSAARVFNVNATTTNTTSLDSAQAGTYKGTYTVAVAF